MNAFLNILRNLGPLRLAAIAIVAFSLLGFFGFLTTRISSSPMALLYDNLDQSDAGAIITKLDALKVPYEVAAQGGGIRVPSGQVGKVRMMIAAEGLPKGGSIGYEIFDQKEGFGTTSFVQNVNHLRALEGELARTISTMAQVQTARVHLVLPQRDLFSRSAQTATASVFLKVRGGLTLGREQVAAIQHLIAAAVPQLQPGQISIVDDMGNLLARPSGEGGSVGGGGSGNPDDMRLSFEQQQARKIEELLFRTIGYGKARAQVSADLDFDRITTSSEIYDPESQVIRSTQTTNEESTSSEDGDGGVTVTNNLPATQMVGGTTGGTANKSNKAEETINYEINKTIRNQVRESGQVRRLSVAVVVDGTYAEGEKGEQIYTARSTEDMDKIKALVRSAVNLDATRGDSLEVVNMPFINTMSEEEKNDKAASEVLLGMPKSELLRMVQTVLLAIIGLLVVLLIVRPILRRLFDSTSGIIGEQQNLLTQAGYAMKGSSGGGAVGHSGGGGSSGGGASHMHSSSGDDDLTDYNNEKSELEKMIAISNVEGRVRESSLHKVGELVEKHPEEAVALLRTWLQSSQSSQSKSWS